MGGPTSSGVTVIIAGQDDLGPVLDRIANDNLQRFQRQAEAAGNALGSGMGHGVTQVQAASAALRSLEGNVPIRAVERFITLLPGVGNALVKAFTVVGLIDFGTMAVETYDKITAAIRRAQNASANMARAFAEANQKMQTESDETALKIAKTQQEIDKLEGHHNNGLAVELAEARVEADKLQESLQNDVKTLGQLLKEQEVSGIAAFFSGEHSTAPLDKDLQDTANRYEDRSAGVQDAYNQDLNRASDAYKSNLAVAKTPAQREAATKVYQAAQESAAKAHYQNMDKLYSDWVAEYEGKANDFRKKQAQAEQSRRDQEDAIRRSLNAGETPSLLVSDGANYGNEIKTADAAAALIRRAQNRFRLTGQLQPLEEQLERDRGAKVDDKRQAEVRAAQEKLNSALAGEQEANARESAARQKANDDATMAELESNHRRLLVSDGQYYSERERLQNASIEAQRDADAKSRAALVGELAKMPGAQKDKAQELDRQAKIATIRAKIADLDAKDAGLTAQQAKNIRERADAETDLQKKRLQFFDQQASTLERSQGGSVSARRREADDKFKEETAPMQLDLQDAVASGDAGRIRAALTTVATANTNKSIADAALDVQGADETYGSKRSSIADERRATDDQLARGQISSQEAQREKIALDKEEAEALQPLLAAYEKLAAAGDLAAVEKVTELQRQITELRNPVNQVAAEIRNQFDSAFESLFENLDQGKKAWDEFGKQLQKDVLKDTYKQFVEPVLQMGMGKLAPNNASSASGGPTTQSALGGFFARMFGMPAAKAQAGSGAPQIQIINQSSQPVQGTASQQSQSGDIAGFLRGPVTQIIIEDLERGGTVSQALNAASSIAG